MAGQLPPRPFVCDRAIAYNGLDHGQGRAALLKHEVAPSLIAFGGNASRRRAEGPAQKQYMRREHFPYDCREIILKRAGISVFYHRHQRYDASRRRPNAINHKAIEGLPLRTQYLRLPLMIHLQEIKTGTPSTR